MESNNTLHVVCAHCRATNRVPAARLTNDPVCGRCGRELLPGRPIELTDANFAESPVISRRFDIRSIPTLVRLDAGRETARQAGALQAAQIVSFAA